MGSARGPQGDREYICGCGSLKNLVYRHICTLLCSVSEKSAAPHKERKFLVFESFLLLLFRFCMVCGQATARGIVTRVVGTMVVVNQICDLCGEESQWTSQPLLGDIPAGNVLLSASILFSGAIPTKVIRLLSSINIKVHSRQSFFNHQRNFLHNAVRQVWGQQQQQILGETPDSGMVLGGDGRCDSMGHCAKYGSYTCVDLTRKKVVDVQLVQVIILSALESFFPNCYVY